MLFGHPVIHRMLKDMVKAEAAIGDSKLKFATTMAKVTLKHFEIAVRGRGVFILLELVENEATKHLVSKQLKAQKSILEDFLKKDRGAKGLVVLLKKVNAL